MCSTKSPGQWCWGIAPTRGWNLLAAHVRSNPVHVIVETETRPERIRNEFKSYASRGLNQSISEKPEG
jgi:REP element-mobilizing transposase RayT